MSRRAVRIQKFPGCKGRDKRLAQPWRLINRQGIPDVGWPLISELHVHLTAVLRWVRPTAPDELAFFWLHPFAYRVYDCIWAYPGRQAPATGAAHFERCSLCRGPSHDEFCMNGASGHRTATDGECQVLQEIGYTLSTRQTSWPENMGTAPCVFRKAAAIGRQGGWFLHFSLRSRDQPKTHVLTSHHQLPSPAPSLVSNAAPTKSSACCRKEYGIVPVSPTGTTGSFPRMYSDF
jgi:hypothetical protein